MKKIIIFLFSIITSVAWAQNVKISAMPTATDLTGTTFIPIIQNGVNKKAPPNLFGAITSVSGTVNRITSTGGAAPVIDVSATFEALLGKVANPLSQFASTTSAQLAGVLSNETGTGVAVFSASPTFTGVPVAPTASLGTNTTQLATTAGVLAEITNASLGPFSTVAPGYVNLSGGTGKILFSDNTWATFGGARTITTASSIVQTDNFGTVYFNGSSPFNFTIDALTLNSQVQFINIGSATVTFVNGTATFTGSSTVASGGTAVILYRTTTAPLITGGGGGGSGTVTSVSVVSANGFAGTVATATTTPAITLTTSITGVLKGNATAILAASKGIDYAGALTPTAVKTTTYTAVVFDYVVCSTTSGGYTVTLPTAPADGSVIGVKIVAITGTNAVIVATGGTDVFNISSGGAALTLNLLDQDVILQYKTGSPGIWYIVKGDPGFTSLFATLVGSETLTNKTISTGSSMAESLLTFTDITTNNVSITKHGFAPKAPNDATKYLDGTGSYSVPAGGGGGGWVVTGNTTITGNTSQTGAFTNTFAMNGIVVTQNSLSSAWVPAIKITQGAHTAMTAATEFIGFDFDAFTWTWNSGTTATERFRYFRSPTINSTSGTATFTDAYNVYIDRPIAGTTAAFTNGPWALGLGGQIRQSTNVIAGGAGVSLNKFTTNVSGTNQPIAYEFESNSNGTGTSTAVAIAQFTFSDGGAKVARMRFASDWNSGTRNYLLMYPNNDAGVNGPMIQADSPSPATLTYANAKHVFTGIAALSATHTLVTITQPASVGGSPAAFLVSGGAHTTLAASAEAVDVDLGLNRTVQFSTGALTMQRAFVVFNPTYGFVGASTITDAATMAIADAPVAGTNATITNRWTLLLQAGNSKTFGKWVYDATITAGGTTGNQTINKPSGTVNIAAGGTTVTVTNSLCTTSSIVEAWLRTNDATARIANVVPGSGSFVVNLTAAATAEVSIGFIVNN